MHNLFAECSFLFHRQTSFLYLFTFTLSPPHIHSFHFIYATMNQNIWVWVREYMCKVSNVECNFKDSFFLLYSCIFHSWFCCFSILDPLPVLCKQWAQNMWNKLCEKNAKYCFLFLFLFFFKLSMFFIAWSAVQSFHVIVTGVLDLFTASVLLRKKNTRNVDIKLENEIDILTQYNYKDFNLFREKMLCLKSWLTRFSSPFI